MNDLRKIHLLG